MFVVCAKYYLKKNFFSFLCFLNLFVVLFEVLMCYSKAVSYVSISRVADHTE